MKFNLNEEAEEAPTLQNPRNPRKKLIPLSPARKNITFQAVPRESLKGAVLELCTYYLEFGLGPAQALRSALADLPEAEV